ncbi:MAG: ArsR family transcriptional regulator [Halapricum sp.]
MANHGLDACLQLVADRNRRRIIHSLRREADGITTFDDLVDQLHSCDSDSRNDTLRNREQLALRLHHTHLPKLADHDIVEFERSTGIVRYHPDERVETVLDSLPGDVSLPNA